MEVNMYNRDWGSNPYSAKLVFIYLIFNTTTTATATIIIIIISALQLRLIGSVRSLFALKARG